jgi:aminoglycoside phosphotransferase (APT) family kinase protein
VSAATGMAGRMARPKLHPGQVDIDEALVRRLLAAQFPAWAGLPLVPVASTGTVNALYRMGDELVVRLPLVERWAAGLVNELEWLPRLAPALPLAVPEPVAAGQPDEGYPFRWAVYRWLDGETWALDRVADACRAAEALADFAQALQAVDPAGNPQPRPASHGGPLWDRDEGVRAALAAAEGMIDTAAIAAAWERALAVPVWDRRPVWVHSDLLAGNVLVRDGRLHAVIDWGGAGVGDPAANALAAWSLFTGESRAVYRAALSVDDDTWERGRGWALTRIMNVPYYAESNPLFVEDAKRTLAEALYCDE